MSSSLVILDLDGTLARGNVSFAFSKYLFKMKKLTLAKMLLLIGMNLAHRCKLCSVESVHAIAFSTIVAERGISEIQQDINNFLHDALPELLRPSLLHLVTPTTWLLSSSPECLVKPIADYLGIPTCFATTYMAEGDRYTHVSQIVTGQKKREILEEYLQASQLDREGIVAYTDSIQDLPLLEGVGRVVAVCPDQRLRKVAREKSWEIIEE